jgi:ABC-2 type transport system ATP-binding protein
MNMDSAINFSDVSKAYRKKRSWENVISKFFLSVDVGQIYGFIGPNGAGKSTTIKIAMSLIRPDKGEVLFFGKSNKDRNARSKIGFVPEEPNLYDHLTGLEFLQFSASLAELPKKDRRENALSLLERVGLSHAGKQRLRSYSKGMKQRLVIAQALLGDPDLIIMDEPLSGLDPVGRMEIKELIASLGKQGKTVFFSSHILSDVESICDQVAVIMDGEIKYTGSPENIEHTFREML